MKIAELSPEQELLAELATYRDLAKEFHGGAYAEWALSVIALIAADRSVLSRIREDEILCVVHHDGHYPDAFADGDTPAEAWQAAKEGIQDS